MSLIERAAAIGATRRPLSTVCSVQRLAEERPEIAAELERALAIPTITATSLAAALAAEYGVRISHVTLARHRRRDCRCPA